MTELAPSTAVSTAISTATWFDAFDDETKTYITSRGLNEKTPAEAFQEAAKAHREAQAYIGVPKEQLLKLPKDATDVAGWDAVYERLGFSKDEAKYAFEGLKKADGTDVDQGLKDFLKAQAMALRLSPEAAGKLAEGVLKFQTDTGAAETASVTAEAARAMEALRQSWGPNYQANQVIADRAYAAIMAAAGFTQEQMTGAIQKLGAVSGKAEVMQMLLAVGMKMGEDSFVGSGGPGGGALRYTKESAVGRIKELMADGDFAKRYLNGGTAEKKEMDDLHQIAYAEEG